MIHNIIKTRYYKAGYEIRTEEVELEKGKKHIMKSAYTPEGWYIGDSILAYRLCNKKGIKPEMRYEGASVCSVGFSEMNQKWYGWSHRAIHGFGIGSTVRKGDCAYTPSGINELVAAYTEWNDLVEIIFPNMIQVSYKMQRVVGENGDGSLILEDIDEMESYKVKTGKGEWTAKTLEDARQMARDFAEGVS